MKHLYLGADLGGTNFRVGLRTAGSETLLDCETVPASAEWTPEELVCRTRELLARIRERHPHVNGSIIGFGVGLTGDIDSRDGVCYSMKRFPRLEAFPLASFFAERFQVPVQILNDGLIAATAELRAGAGRGLRDFVMVTLGTGVGGGVVIDGRVLAGARGRIGKVGHQILNVDGPVHCHCGLQGCWQTFIGKEGVEARARSMSRLTPRSGLARLVREDGSVDLQQVVAAAAAGDFASQWVMKETGRYLGVGLANLVKIFAPEAVIVGGGLAEGNRLLFETAERTLREYAIKPYQHVPLLAAAAGKNAGVTGATFLAEEAARPAPLRERRGVPRKRAGIEAEGRLHGFSR